MSREVVFLSGVRTAIGTFGGALSGTAPIDLAAQCTKEALDRAETAPEEVGHVVFGNVIHTEPRDMYLSRVAMIDAGIHNGDVVVIREQPDADNGDIIVALIEDEEATLKRLRRRGSAIALEAANPAYETRVYRDDQVRIQGRMVGLIRTY